MGELPIRLEHQNLNNLRPYPHTQNFFSFLLCSSCSPVHGDLHHPSLHPPQPLPRKKPARLDRPLRLPCESSPSSVFDPPPTLTCYVPTPLRRNAHQPRVSSFLTHAKFELARLLFSPLLRLSIHLILGIVNLLDTKYLLFLRNSSST